MTNSLSAANTLRVVAEANEDLKRVVAIASRLRLVAINASLMARRAGSRARGYSVTALELRRFGEKLGGNVGEMSMRMGVLVGDIAHQLKQNRARGYLAAAAAAACGREDIAEVARRGLTRLREDQERIALDWAALLNAIHRGATDVNVGQALARAARIEAVHGGDLAPALCQVADDVEATIAEVRGAILSAFHRIGGIAKDMHQTSKWAARHSPERVSPLLSGR